MSKNFVVQVTEGEEVWFLHPEKTGRYLNETDEVVLRVGRSPVPVAMEEGSANFWAPQLQGIDGVKVEVKALRDIDWERQDT